MLKDQGGRAGERTDDAAEEGWKRELGRMLPSPFSETVGESV